MNELDYAYKALKEYRKVMDTVPEVKNFLDFVRPNDDDITSLVSSTKVCIIDPDWVEAIQKGMPFIMDAVLENRQFVKSDGIVLPIEKIRVVGKDSIEDLAKHSSYITKKPGEDGRIVPDKLMMPQKDNDYAVYENRFLYTLLVYLSQFIEIRLNEILAITSKYESKTRIVLTKNSNKRRLVYEMSMSDDRFDDPYSSKASGSSDVISIVKQCLNDTKAMLMTPLMKIVSKSPMVSSPIVKTNVFRFDHNFKESLALFEFLQGYSKKGFTVKDISKNLTPFRTEMVDQYSELIYLTSYLSYVYGNGIQTELKKQYEANLKEEKRLADEKVLADIRRVQREIQHAGLSAEQYVQLMEKGQKILEKKLLQKEQEIDNIRNEGEMKLKEANFLFQKDLEDNAKEYEQKLQEEREKMDTEAKKQNQLLQSEMFTLKNTIQENEVKHRQNLISVREEERTKVSSELQGAQDKLQKQNEEFESFRHQMEEENHQNRKEKEDLENKIRVLEEEKFQLQKEVDALREMNHLKPSRDLTEKENFLVLEKEKEAFDKLFQRNWKETKKRIRKEAFSQKPVKKEKKNKQKES